MQAEDIGCRQDFVERLPAEVLSKLQRAVRIGVKRCDPSAKPKGKLSHDPADGATSDKAKKPIANFFPPDKLPLAPFQGEVKLRKVA